jgi:hypothetical protein
MDQLSQGIAFEVDKGILTLKIDISGKGEVSKSGKTTVFASTRGNLGVPGTDGGVLGLNFYRKR